MVEIIDLNKCELSCKNGTYGGAAGDKVGVLVGGNSWLIKMPKNIKALKGTGNASYSTSPLCEFIGSHIYEILGYDVHKTLLGIYHEKLVVACKDFATDAILLEIRTIKNFMNEELSEEMGIELDGTGSDHCVDLETLLLHLEHNPILLRVRDIQKRFWEQAVVDILINNNDRNNGNWGILRHSADEDTLAPIFDNGGCLQNKISETKIENILTDLYTMRKNAINVNTVYSKKGHQLSAKKFLNLYKEHEELKAAIVEVVPKIAHAFGRIEDFMDQIPETYTKDGKVYEVCSKNRRKLYKLQMHARLTDLLVPYYYEITGEAVGITRKFEKAEAF